MKRSILYILVCIFVTGLFAVLCPAQIEEIAIGNTFGVGARSMGMGGASLGIADDFTALYWNPAGMAQIQKFEFFTSFSQNTASTNTFFTEDDEIRTRRTRVRPNSIGFVYPFYAQQGGLAIAFGYNRPQNFDFQKAIHGIDPNTRPVYSNPEEAKKYILTYDSLLIDEMKINSGGIGIWSFGASVYISKDFLIGGAIDLWSGNNAYDLDVMATDALDVDEYLSHFKLDDEIDREYSGIGGRIGLLANFIDVMSLGVTFITPTQLSVEERWREYSGIFYGDGDNESIPTDGIFSYNIEKPFEIGTGVALKLLNKQLVLAADVNFVDWQQTRYDPEPADDISTDHFEEYYDPALQVKLGAEFRIPVIDTHLRLGYFRDTIPLADVEVENERDYLTFGVGKIFEDSIKFDFAYMWGNWQHYRNHLTTERNTHRFFVSGAYRF